MRVVVVSSSEEQGGAAKAALRLHQSLNQAGVDSFLVVQEKTTDRSSVMGSPTPFSRFMGKLRPSFEPAAMKMIGVKPRKIFSLGWFSNKTLIKQINDLTPDVVHLHWVNRATLGINDLLKIKAPLIWSFHDMWPLTGGCHYDDGCGKFRTECKKCPQIKSQTFFDIANTNFAKKKKIYKKIKNMTLVGLSHWISKEARTSALLRDFEIKTLPNPIDTTLFKNIDSSVARSVLKLPQKKKLLMYSAMSALSDTRKGYQELMEAIKLSSSDFEIVVFGSEGDKECFIGEHRIHFLGTLKDDYSLVLAYSAADMVAVPSLQENLSNTIMEALSCNTPVVAFDIGGNADMVDEMNGYLAKPFDVADFAKGIDQLMNWDVRQGDNCRESVIENFDSIKVVESYIKLYEKVCSVVKRR